MMENTKVLFHNIKVNDDFNNTIYIQRHAININGNNNQCQIMESNTHLLKL
jgi:uncharacterized protein YpiB (UPF0302 family)